MSEQENQNNNQNNDQNNSNQNASWTSTLSEEFRGLPSISKFKSADDLAKSYVNLEKLVGLEKIALPKDEKDEAGWSTVYSRLGRPESADKYDLKLNLAEGLKVPDEAINGLKQAGFKSGFSNKQLQSIVDHWVEIENQAYLQRVEASKQAELNTETGLRKKLGANYEASKKNVEAFIRNFAPQEEQEGFLDAIKRDSALFETLYNASKNMGEDVLKGGSKPAGFTPEEAELEYKRLTGDMKSPYWNPNHPEHEIAKKRAFDLLMFMNAGERQA